MKKIIFFTLLLTVSAISFSQPANALPALTKQDLLQKSKQQKTAAWVLVAGGAVLIVTGSVVWANDINKAAETDPLGGIAAIYTSTSGYGLAVAGLVAAAGSIPLFIAAARNKRKAMSISLKNEAIPQLQNGSFVNRSVPSLSLKINL
jgi:hypothetical protein